MKTNDDMNESLNDEEWDGEVPGSIDVDLGLTINLSNYNSLKINIGLNEPYTGREGDTREDKVNELFDYIQEKIAEKAAELTKSSKKLLKDLGGG